MLQLLLIVPALCAFWLCVALPRAVGRVRAGKVPKRFHGTVEEYVVKFSKELWIYSWAPFVGGCISLVRSSGMDDFEAEVNFTFGLSLILMSFASLISRRWLTGEWFPSPLFGSADK